MSGSYVPYGNNLSSYANRPEHLFFANLGMRASPLDNPATIEAKVQAPSVTAPAEITYPGAGINNDPVVQTEQSPPGTTFGQWGMNSLAGASMALGGMPGLARGLASLAVTDMRGMPPSLDFTKSVVTPAINAVMSILSPDNKPSMAMVDESVPSDSKTMGVDGGPKGSESFGENANASNSPSGESVSAGTDADSAGAGTYARGGLIQMVGGGKVAVGLGGGLDDLIPTTVEGRRIARLSDGEFVVPADVVSMMGDGSSRAGSQRLYDLVKGIRSEKTGTTQQAGPLQVGEILRRIFQ